MGCCCGFAVGTGNRGRCWNWRWRRMPKKQAELERVGLLKPGVTVTNIRVSPKDSAIVVMCSDGTKEALLLPHPLTLEKLDNTLRLLFLAANYDGRRPLSAEEALGLTSGTTGS